MDFNLPTEETFKKMASEYAKIKRFAIPNNIDVLNAEEIENYDKNTVSFANDRLKEKIEVEKALLKSNNLKQKLLQEERQNFEQEKQEEMKKVAERQNEKLDEGQVKKKIENFAPKNMLQNPMFLALALSFFSNKRHD